MLYALREPRRSIDTHLVLHIPFEVGVYIRGQAVVSRRLLFVLALLLLLFELKLLLVLRLKVESTLQGPIERLTWRLPWGPIGRRLAESSD